VKVSAGIFKTTGLIAGIIFLSLFTGHLSMAFAAVISAETMESAVRTYVEKNMPWPEGTVRIELLDRMSDLTVSGENVSYRVQSGRNSDFIGMSSFFIRFYEKDVFLTERMVKAKLEISMDVVISAKPLSRGINIDRNDVKLIKRWFTHTPENILSNLDDVVGMKLRSSVKSNTEIRSNMVKSVPIVKRGKPVKIIFDNGLMNITTIGKSEQDGMYGDLIKVRNASSKKIIYARVMGNSLVRMEF